MAAALEMVAASEMAAALGKATASDTAAVIEMAAGLGIVAALEMAAALGRAAALVMGAALGMAAASASDFTNLHVHAVTEWCSLTNLQQTDTCYWDEMMSWTTWLLPN